MIAGQCELCERYVDTLYDATEFADMFDLPASFNKDEDSHEVYNICPDCLNRLEEVVHRIWHRKVEE